MAQKGTITKGLFLGILIIVGIALPFFSGNFIIRFVTNTLMFAILASAWNIIGGYTGYASFGNVVFLGIGAYVSAVLMEKGGIPFWVSFPVSGFAAAIFAILIGLPVLRLKGHYFAIATLGVAEAMKALVDNLEITEGNSGIYLPVMHLSVKSQYIFFYFMMLGVLVLTLVVTYIFLKKKLGYGLIAIREDEEAAKSLGVNTTLFKVTSFALSGFFSGLAGSLYAYQQGFIKPESVFDVGVTIKMIVMAVFGGIGSDETYRYGGYVGDKFDKFGIRLGFEREETGGYPTTLVTSTPKDGNGTLTGGYPTTDRYGNSKWVVGDMGDNWAKRQNINLMAFYDLTETGRVSLDFQYGQHQYGYGEPNTYLIDASGDPSFSGTVDVGGGQSASVKPYNYIYYTGIGNEDSYLASLRYKETFGIVGFTGKIGYQFNNKWYTTTTDKTGTYDNATGKLSDADTETWLADLQADMPLGDSHVLTCGVSFKTDNFKQNEYNLSFYRDEDSKQDKTYVTRGEDLFYALYVQDEWKVLDQLTFYGGLRLDFWRADGKSGTVDDVKNFDELQDHL